MRLHEKACEVALKRNALTYLLLLTSCSQKVGVEYAAAWSPNGQDKASLVRIPTKMGLSSEFEFRVQGKNTHLVKTLLKTDETNWRAAFAEVFWSQDSEVAGFVMSNSYAPESATEAIDVRSGLDVKVASLLPAIRNKMLKKWGQYLDLHRDPIEQAQRPGKILNDEFLHRIRIKEEANDP